MWCAGDERAWRPAPELRELWLRVRIAALHAVWERRTATAMGGSPHTAAAAIASLVHLVRGNILTDWQRVVQGRQIDAADTQVGCSHWWRGAPPVIIEQQFVQRWCRRGVLCRVVGGNLELRLVPALPELTDGE